MEFCSLSHSSHVNSFNQDGTNNVSSWVRIDYASADPPLPMMFLLYLQFLAVQRARLDPWLCTSWWLEILQQTHDFNNKSEIPGLSKQVQLLLIVLCTVVKLTCWPAMHERPTRYATSDIKPGTRQFAHKRYVPVAPTTSGKNKIHCTCCKHKLVVAGWPQIEVHFTYLEGRPSIKGRKEVIQIPGCWE